MLKHKKFLTAMMIFIIATLVASGCSESDKSVEPVSNTYHEFTDDNGKTYNYDTADPEFIAAKAQSEALNMWVERMDPFVTETKDGTYDFDHISFQAEYGELDDISETTIKQLKNGIPVVNQKIQEQNRSGNTVAAGLWARWHWWGITYCYTDYWAYIALGAAQLSNAIPFIGVVVSSGMTAWMAYYLDHYGGFCINQTWYGAVWLSAP